MMVGRIHCGIQMQPKRKHSTFLPPLMHAFRDAFRQRDSAKLVENVNDAGERIIAGRRASPRSAIPDAVLRRELAEDLASLLNTTNLESAEDLADVPEVRRSILNYGISDLAAITSDSLPAAVMTARLKDFLDTYEPRLVPGTISVKPEPAADDASGRLRFHVSADMYSTPVDVSIEFVAEVEVDGGQVKILKL
jgi:type VI secretion system protein ImpF